MKILLIEPDKKLGGLYQAALEKAGHKVQQIAHAQDAVHAADKQKPGLVVLELQLAGHGGIEFLHEFRSYSEWQGIPIVVLTMVPPESLQITKDIMQTFGIVDILYKPSITLQQLINAVSEIAI